MAFVFTVEDGTGLSNATSYVSVSDADDFLAVNIHVSDTWMALDIEQKEKLLSWASRYLDEKVRWYGDKYVATSSLRWPRSRIVDRDNLLIPSNVIPAQLKIATAEMARYLLTSDRTVERDQDALKRVKADVVEVEFDNAYRLPQVPSYISALITGLGAIHNSSGGMQVKRLIR